MSCFFFNKLLAVPLCFSICSCNPHNKFGHPNKISDKGNKSVSRFPTNRTGMVGFKLYQCKFKSFRVSDNKTGTSLNSLIAKKHSMSIFCVTCLCKKIFPFSTLVEFVSIPVISGSFSHLIGLNLIDVECRQFSHNFILLEHHKLLKLNAFYCGHIQ